MGDSISHKRFSVVLITTGFTAMLSQILLLREMVSVFLGNELSIGMMLGGWLLGTAIGSLLLIRLIPSRFQTIPLFICLHVALAGLMPVTILLTRLSPGFWSLTRGEMVSLPVLLSLPFTVMLPMCILIGLLYTLGCVIYHRLSGHGDSAIARVYLLEAAGSGLASLIVSTILLRFMDTHDIVIFVSVVYIITAFYMLGSYRPATWIVKILLLLLIPILVFLYPSIDRKSTARFWDGFDVKHTETSIYGNIVILGLGESVSFYENGTLMFTYPDRLYAEESVHFAMLQHPDPESVLLIGGGAGGSADEILKHPSVKRLEYVELDPKIIELSRRYLPETVTRLFEDTRLRVIHQDGRRYLKETVNSYDVIIVNLPDPHTTLMNRFYSLEFFQEAKRKLGATGIIAFSVSSQENAIGRDLAAFLSCLRATLEKSFADVVIIPGDVNHFIGCVAKGIISDQSGNVVARLMERNLNTLYLNPYYIPYRMSAERVEYVRQRSEPRSDTQVNRDYQPVGHFYQMLVWTTHFNQDVKRILGSMAIHLKLVIAIVLILFLIPFFVYGSQKSRPGKGLKYGVIISIACVGFSGMALEVVIIHAFQAICGYVYYQVAIILTSFMVGMACGSYSGIRYVRQRDNVLPAYSWNQAGLAIYSLLMTVTLSVIHMTGFVELLFFLFTLFAGFITGFHFPLASHLYGIFQMRIERVAGSVYASDLLGACAGAIVTSTILIPVLGIIRTGLVIAILNISIFTGLMLIRPNAKPSSS
jgi:spermidine synthase